MATTRRQSGDFLPLARHEPLLRALLATDAAAAPAALQWLEAIDFDVIDVAEQRLMPFFDSRLRALALDHPAKGKVRGLYRRAWYVEQTMRHELGRILSILEEDLPRVVLLKGAALSRLVYDHPAHRPYGDFDLLVPYDHQRRAIAALRRVGGITSPGSFHATSVRMPSGFSVDLHRSPYHAAFRADHVAPLFSRLRVVDALQSEGAASASRWPDQWWTLSNADQLLHTIMHGLSPGSPPPIRWIVDGVLLIRRERGRIDWDLFQHEAGRLAFVEPAIVGLREILRHEPDMDAARVLLDLERRTSPSAVAQWCEARRDPGMIAIWDMTRRNAKGWRRLGLVARIMLEQHGVVGLARASARKGIPALRALIGILLERRRREAEREGV